MKPARVFVPAILSGLLLWTAFFPLDLGPVAFFALAPLLTLVRAPGVGRGRRYTAALVGGLTFSVLACKWVRVAHPMMALFAWPGMALYVALYWPLAIFLLRRLDNTPAGVGLPRFLPDPWDGGPPRPPLALTVPLVWVGLEYVRGHFPTGFPPLRWVGAYQPIGFGWYFLGYSQHGFVPLLQAAELGGVYLVSVVVAAANGAAYEWLVRSHAVRWLLRWPRGWQPFAFFREMTITAGVVGLAAALLGYGGFRLIHAPFPPGPTVALLQGNIAQEDKMFRGEQLPDGRAGPSPLQKEYFRLADGAAIRRPDLIVWPETCFPGDWITAAPGVADPPAEFRADIDQCGRIFRSVVGNRWKANTLFGLNALTWDGRAVQKANSALLVRADGTPAGRYDKMHLVPFGEYVPLKAWLPWLQRFTPYDHDYGCTPGDAFPRFELPAAGGKIYRFGVLICYEDTDPDFARRYNPLAGGGPGADFLVNMSNDGWFDGTEEHEEHLAICRFRAVECRRSVVRAVNMGISAVIDPDGRVVAQPAETWAKGKKVPAVVRAAVPLDTRDSVYAAAGDWVPGVCWVVIGIGLVAGRGWRRGGLTGPRTGG